MKIVYIYRDPVRKGKSFETIFKAVSEGMRNKFDIEEFYYNDSQDLFGNLKRLWQIKADIYHITGSVYFLTIFMPFRKYIITIHDVGRYRNLKGLKKVIYGLAWIKLPCIIANKITTVSNYTKDELIGRFRISRRRITVINNPIMPTYRRNKKTAMSEEPVLLQVGTKPQKNLARVIRALEGIDCRLITVGQLTNELVNQLKQCKIKYENFCDITEQQLYSKYCQSDIVLFVSTYEGFGMPIIEANSIGRVVITSDVTAIPEVVGCAGLKVNPYSEAQIRAAIKEVISNGELREKLIEEGYKNAERFRFESIVERYTELYK